MHRHTPLPASENCTMYHSTGGPRLQRKGNNAGALGTVALASTDHAPPKTSPGITGHDLMAMFPAKSPHTVRMGSESRCTVFTAQERAFLSSPPQASSRSEVKERRFTDGDAPPGLTSDSSPSPEPLSAGRGLLADGEPITARGDDRRPLADTHGRDGGVPNESAKRRSRATTCADLAQLNSQRASRDPVPGGTRRARTRRSSLKFVIESSPSDQSENDRFQDQAVKAVHARRVDKKTGITFIETEYRRSDDKTLFILVNEEM